MGTPKRGLADPDRRAAALMLAATVLAIVWANSPWGDGYEHLWSMPVTIGIGDMQLHSTLHSLVNDGLMTLFFFLVGLEVKRELTIGELTDRTRALVPITAAIAGLIVPAAIFALITASSGNAQAWGVVISTDTAFLIGALAIIGPKFPARLRTFLLTLAVVDDIGALLAIGLFYSSGIDPTPFIVAILLMAAIAAVRFLPFGRGFSYGVLGIALWVATLLSGIHPTLAGVAIALLIPVFPPRRADVERTAELSRAFRESPNTVYAAAVSRSLRESLSINERIDAAWRPYISFGVLPIFALANAGVHLDPATLATAISSPVTWGVIIALVAGKFIGITGATWALRAAGKGQLAPGLGMQRIAGGAALSGIGFTIALFLVPIAIPDEETQDLARVGILVASVLAFGLGWAIIAIGDRIRPPMAVGATLNRPVDPTRDHIKGPVDAEFTIVEYGDFECPYCGRATGSIDEVFAYFGTRLRWVWRHLPLDQPHPHAQQAAQAYEAASRQGRFIDMSRKLFAHQLDLETDDLFRYAEEIGLDMDRFAEDFRSPQTLRRIQDDRLDAELMDLHSTPTFFIGSHRHRGPWDSANLIRALEASAPSPSPAPR
ncbi:Na+/H+ antiporter NhaA [Microbacterium sp. cx-55]|uniref:Na+/H+ antiporter NhaA n=1 Tax=unclassified Microbacterium TaxID=2609290 RepID=UPI001CBFA824|nr:MULTISPECIES: Na+/H+ antiporter NhaA [unclassified Microbacterium]MBZ4488039.1 Na+/H+ antiporter NhaA [Microbacterium sp. cx-55]MCC4908929.1 Na+/H+ antiporter NhaA [Microbacterium sp. cx-59]UGB34555.1 Na+/H+ antiporter NhaA [Microbacterium sp. cx-55]